MPQYLRTSSVRLLEASLEALNLAFIGLGMPVRRELRVASTQFAAPAGLIGAAVEQALSSILVQVLGEEALMSGPNQFKSAREILRSVRGLLKAPVPRVSFLTVGVDDAASHRDQLYKATEGFVLIIGERAAGLHAGYGPSRAVAMLQAQKVLDFYDLLAKSNRVRPYLDNLPRPPEQQVNSDVLVDDLARRFIGAETLGERNAALRSLFLVLPEVPNAAPEWLEAFDRSAIVPTIDDINILLRTLERAEPVKFHRLNQAGSGIGVSVQQQDPNALPIAQHHLRRAFGDVLGQFEAYVGTANGRLDDGHLDVPPESFLLDLFVLGPAQLCITLNRTQLTAHEIWPFVMTALSVQGTIRPFWFLVSLSDNLGQLLAQLQRAFKVTRRANLLQQREPTLEALKALKNRKLLEPPALLAQFSSDAFGDAERVRGGLSAAIERSRGTVRAIPPDVEAVLHRVAEGEAIATEAFGPIMSAAAPEARKYWSRLLAESATDVEDRDMLVQIIRHEDLVAAHTPAKKALRLIDAITYGPQIDLE